MTKFTNKIDFIALATVNMANPNGDPLNGNQPRVNYDGYGEISDVCIKRKIRNRMQDLGNNIFVQSDERSDDGCHSLSERAKTLNDEFKKVKDNDLYASKACEKWLDVRSFGQVFGFSGVTGLSVGVRGPVSVHTAFSVNPVEIESMQITKSVSGSSSSSKDTMGMKHFVRFGLYVIKGSINVQLAEKTGFTEEDAEVLKESLKTLFINDTSAARPDGSMEINKLYWFKHNCKDGQYSSAKVHNSISIKLMDDIDTPSKFEDYIITENSLDGLKPEIYEGI